MARSATPRTCSYSHAPSSVSHAEWEAGMHASGSEVTFEHVFVGSRQLRNIVAVAAIPPAQLQVCQSCISSLLPPFHPSPSISPPSIHRAQLHPDRLCGQVRAMLYPVWLARPSHWLTRATLSTSTGVHMHTTEAGSVLVGPVVESTYCMHVCTIISRISIIIIISRFYKRSRMSW